MVIITTTDSTKTQGKFQFKIFAKMLEKKTHFKLDVFQRQQRTA